MKFSVIFVIIALLFIVTSGKKTAPKCNPLTLKCRCSNVPNIVCGVSGKTHVNPCIANCFGDKVKHVGPCTNQCHNTNKKCAYKSFGHDGGKRLQCCDQVKVCFGKTCTESLKHCIWKGDVLKKKKYGHCFWKKRKGSHYQRTCCKWSKVCKGHCRKGTRRCYLTAKRCKWTGRTIRTRKNKKCTKVHLEHGTRKRCCVYKRKCINYDRLTCKSKRKPKCWATRKCKYVGAYIKKSCSRKCQTVAVSKFGKRRRCCQKCRTCSSYRRTNTPNLRKDICETRATKCVWKGPVVVTRHHKKCAIKAYGYNKDRKRCCRWSIRCIGKHCKVVHKKCVWKGCVIKTSKKKSM